MAVKNVPSTEYVAEIAASILDHEWSHATGSKNARACYYCNTVELIIGDNRYELVVKRIIQTK